MSGKRKSLPTTRRGSIASFFKPAAQETKVANKLLAGYPLQSSSQAHPGCPLQTGQATPACKPYCQTKGKNHCLISILQSPLPANSMQQAMVALMSRMHVVAEREDGLAVTDKFCQCYCCSELPNQTEAQVVNVIAVQSCQIRLKLKYGPLFAFISLRFKWHHRLQKRLHAWHGGACPAPCPCIERLRPPVLRT